MCVNSSSKQTRILHNSVPKGSDLHIHPNIYFSAHMVKSVQHKVKSDMLRIYLKCVFEFKYKYF